MGCNRAFCDFLGYRREEIVGKRTEEIFEDTESDQFKAKGVELCCLSVNDAFVMKAWQEAQNAADITMLADGDGSWTRALGLAKETGAFGGVRAQRFALIANDGVVERLFVEAPGKFEVSDAQSLLAAL